MMRTRSFIACLEKQWGSLICALHAGLFLNGSCNVQDLEASTSLDHPQPHPRPPQPSPPSLASMAPSASSARMSSATERSPHASPSSSRNVQCSAMNVLAGVCADMQPPGNQEPCLELEILHHLAYISSRSMSLCAAAPLMQLIVTAACRTA